MIVLGVWDGHDAGAALIVDGSLVCAVNEERFTRRKLEIRFPFHSIKRCLELAGASAADVDVVATCTGDVAKTMARWAPSLKERYYRIRRRQTPPGLLADLQKRAKYWIPEWGPTRLSRSLSVVALRRELRTAGLASARLLLLDHHDCHASAAAWGSGFPSCAVLTIDGVGDGLSSTISAFTDGRLRRMAASRARDSLGIFFEHVTNLLNMRELEDEGKVMALADYAAPIPDADNPLLGLFSLRDGRLTAATPGHGMSWRLRRVLWRYPNEQFAYLAQRTVETVCARLAQEARRLTGLTRLAIAGGVASNIKATRRIALAAGVDDVYVLPHMGDGGLALGAAVSAAWSLGQALTPGLGDLALGPEYGDADLAASLDVAGLAVERHADLPCQIAELIAADRVVFWFQGRMEYGPRALGCRSVLARPDSVAVKDRLNQVLKRRVWYQPFCPSLLESDARRILEDHAGRMNSQMTTAFAVKPAFRDALAGVTSLDGICRPQIVPDGAPGRFADLLRAVKAKRGLGVLLNTSFNVHGEPLVCNPDEACDVFVRTRGDVLAMGPYLARL
jgi:carbamoyltransferase